MINMKKTLSIISAVTLSFSLFSSVSIADQHAVGHEHESNGVEVHALPREVNPPAEHFIVEKGITEKAIYANIENADGVKETVTFEATTTSGSNLEVNDSSATFKAMLNEISSARESGDTVINVRIAADEEYRKSHSNWVQYTKDIVERADDTFNRDFGIDFNITSYVEWQSEGNNSSEILADLQREWGDSQYDFVMGFSDDGNFKDGGIAYVYNSAPSVGISVMADQSYSATWHTVIHEIGHNYGLSHHKFGSFKVCIMNYTWSYIVDDFESGHERDIMNRKHWYGKKA
ncbi:M12 family metallo-peptidase [Longirhabdus pacifica]|uniref:M12 family metallo-peptidase n=1 Tax=Longirhabdus pacifica TaxID=2305227 RepID=UPI0013E8BE70|nr:M12 family metallo-peptidase [Longirhabdus pacifica]